VSEAGDGLSRRQALTALGVGVGALVAEQALVAGGIPPGVTAQARAPQANPGAAAVPGGYAPDGTAGRRAALPLNQVELLDSPFKDNQARNTSYLLFLDPERMLRSFRLNYGQPSAAEPIGGWERPASQIRGHTTGHLMSGLALTYASTGDDAARTRGRYLVSQLAALQARADLEQALAGSRDLGEQLKQARQQLDSLRSELSGSKIVETRLSDRLRESELRFNGMTAELTRLQAARSEDTELIASQKFHLRELTDRINTESDTIDRERKLLVADLNIRELMGARNLHIVDVFDVDGKGKTQRPFGRVFYTEAKSLIFYAFDLKGGATFQAWGQREARDESAQSLGIFYVDDQKQNRWVLKFEDPKVLAQINAVFVTVEPPGGSVKPNRQKMLYAYLNATPNHP